MDFGRFREVYLNLWNRYLRTIYENLDTKRVHLDRGKLFFPTFVVFTETREHFIAELFGASDRFTKLKWRQDAQGSTAAYMFQFGSDDTRPIILFDSRNTLIKNLMLTRQNELDGIRERFHFDPSPLYPTKFVMPGSGGSLVGFGQNLHSCYMDNCLLINKKEQVYRMKLILHMVVLSKAATDVEFKNDYVKLLRWPVASTIETVGMFCCEGDSERPLLVCGGFASLYLSQDRENAASGRFSTRIPTY